MRVLLMGSTASSDLVAIATGGTEIGALTVTTIGFRERGSSSTCSLIMVSA